MDTTVTGASGRPLLRIQAATNMREPRAVSAPVQLSRFAVVHGADNALVVESPTTGAAVTLLAPALGALLPSFAAGYDPAGAPEDVVIALGWLAATGVVVPSGSEAADPVTRLRRPHDVWFHAARRRGLTHRPLGATWPGRGQSPPPAVAPRPYTRWVDLDAPRPCDDPGFFAVLGNRRSRRTFTPPHIDDVSAALWHTLRIVEQQTNADGWEITRRACPSGGGTHDLDAFVVAGRCDGLDAGVWWYDPHGHRLGCVSTAPADTAPPLLEAAVAMVAAAAPPVVFVLSARFLRTAWKYDGIAYSLTLTHVGVATATLCLVAEALGLAACPLGTGDSAWFARVVGADVLEESSVGEVAFGARA